MIHAEQIAALEGKFCLTDISLSPAAIESASQAQVVTTDQETGPVTEIRTHSREAHYRMTAVFLSNGADRPNLQWLVDQANREIRGRTNWPNCPCSAPNSSADQASSARPTTAYSSSQTRHASAHETKRPTRRRTHDRTQHRTQRRSKDRT